MTSAYYRYDASPEIRAISFCPWGSGSALLIPAWANQSAYLFSSGLVSGTPISGSTFPGYVGATSDGASGAWLLPYAGPITRYRSNGTLTPLATPSGVVFTGLTNVSGAPIAIDAAGKIYAKNGSTAFSVTGSVSGAAQSLVASGTLLYTIMQGASGLGTFNTLTLASGFIAAPFPVVSCVAAAPTRKTAIGGWDFANIPSGFAALAGNPVSGTILAAAASAGGGSAQLWDNDGFGNWTLGQTVGSLGAPSALVWLPTGAGLFYSSAAGNTLQVLSYAFGALALAQTLSVSGAAAVAVTLDSQNALVCQPSLNTLQPLTISGSGWVVSGSVAIGNPQSVIALTATTAAVGCSSGLAFLSLVAGAWNVSSTVSLPFVPTQLARDNAGTVYAAGPSGTTTRIYANGISTLYVGGLAGMFWEQGQLVLADETNSLLRVYEFFQNVFTAQTTLTGPSGMAALATAGGGSTIFAAGSGAAWQCEFTSPWQLRRIRYGKASAYNGTTWTTTNLKAGHTPEALTLDPSGNITVATLQNELFTVSPTGGVISSGIVTQLAGQPQSTPLGISSLLWQGAALYATSSLNQAFMRLI